MLEWLYAPSANGPPTPNIGETMNIPENKPVVNDFRGSLRSPEGDIAVSLEQLKLDLRYGGFSRDFLRFLFLSVISFMQEEGAYA